MLACVEGRSLSTGVELPEYGKDYRVCSLADVKVRAAPRLLLEVLSLRKRPAGRSPRRLVNGATQPFGASMRKTRS